MNNSFEKINLIHNSDEWLKFRQSGIGGSDASAILGLNPWKSNVELWKEKTGLADPKKINCLAAVEYGKAAEDALSHLFALDYPKYEVNIVKDTVYRKDFMFASLDGELTEKATGRKGILEIKTTTIFASMRAENWNDKIPDNYYIQVLHYMAVTNAEFVVLKAQLKSELNGDVYLRTKHYQIERSDVEEDIQYLISKENEFWELVKNKKQPALILNW